MLDKRNKSHKFNNPNNERDAKTLKKRNLEFYEDESFNDILGYGKLLYHPEKIVSIKKDENSFPITATLSLGNYCNHGCLWCSTAYSRVDEATSIDGDKLLNWLQNAKKRGLKGIGYVGNGEPLAFKKFKQICEEAQKLDLDQGIFTNGYLIDRYLEHLLNFVYVRISLDAGSKKIHSWLHAVKENHFPKILENGKLLSKNKKSDKPAIGFQFATHQHNINDLENAVKLAIDCGAQYLSIKPVFDRGSVRDKIEKNSLQKDDLDKAYDKVSKYNSKSFKIFYRPHQIISESSEQNMLVYSRCYAPYVGINIYEDGSIVGCGPHNIKIGTLDTPLEELEDNISRASKKLNLVNCPAGCRYHAMNYIIEQIKNPTLVREKKHTNML